MRRGGGGGAVSLHSIMNPESQARVWSVTKKGFLRGGVKGLWDLRHLSHPQTQKGAARAPRTASTVWWSRGTLCPARPHPGSHRRPQAPALSSPVPGLGHPPHDKKENRTLGPGPLWARAAPHPCPARLAIASALNGHPSCPQPSRGMAGTPLSLVELGLKAKAVSARDLNFQNCKMI